MNFRESMTASTHPRTQARTLFSDPTRVPSRVTRGKRGLVLAFLPRFARRAAEFVSVRLLSIMAFSPAGVIRARTDGRTLIGLGRSPSGTPAHQLSHSRQRRKRPASIASLVLVEKARNGEPCRFPDGCVFPADPRARARARARVKVLITSLRRVGFSLLNSARLLIPPQLIRPYERMPLLRRFLYESVTHNRPRVTGTAAQRSTATFRNGNCISPRV